MHNKTLEIDMIGQYYSSINNSKQPGVFALSVYLKDSINSKILQQAVGDLMQRLPFLNGRLKYGFFHYEYEILKNYARIEPDINEPLFSDYYNKGNRHMIKIVYGKQYFTVKATHSLCDGRGLSKITKALLVRYFELLGLNIEKNDIIDCNGKFLPEEAEDAVRRFMSEPPIEGKSKTTHLPKKVYQIQYSKNSPQKIITTCFDANKIKAAAKSYNVTISEYLLATIFRGIASKRAYEDKDKKITGSVQIDCRGFFSSNSLRNFVTSKIVTMKENQSFGHMAKQIKKNFEEITGTSVHQQLYEQLKAYDSLRFVPRVLKSIIMKTIGRLESAKTTTGLSNLGLIQLPKNIQQQIEKIEFPIAIEEGNSNFFSCVTTGNTLALTATFREEARNIVEEVLKIIKHDIEINSI